MIFQVAGVDFSSDSHLSSLREFCNLCEKEEETAEQPVLHMACVATSNEPLISKMLKDTNAGKCCNQSLKAKCNFAEVTPGDRCSQAEMVECPQSELKSLPVTVTCSG